MSSLKNKFLDKYGQPIMTNRSNGLSKKAFSQFGSIYSYPNAGRFHSRTYVNQDSELGIDQYSRDLLLRWSRELAAQQPWIYGAIRTLSTFAVGDQYEVKYKGDNSKNGKIYEDWIRQVFSQNCSSRGPNIDFRTLITLLGEMVDQDGDVLLIFGEDESGPKVQTVAAHRIRTMHANPFDATNNAIPGPYPNTVVSDGVIYNLQGKPLGYSVQSPKNLVNSVFNTTTDNSETIISVNNSRLVYEPRFFDKGRGIPTISSGILQALSIEEVESYMIEKLKIQSMYAVVEKTPEGEGPIEEEAAYRRAINNNTALNGFSIVTDQNQNASQGLRVVSNPAVKYVTCSGGDIKFPAASITEKETSEFINRLERGVLSCLGVPHALLFSPDDISGKMNSSTVEIFNGAIRKRQKLLDFHGNFIISWAVAKAIKNGELPPSDDEALTDCFEFTHPKPFSIDDDKQNRSDLASYEAGTMSLGEIASKKNTTSQEIIDEIKNENIEFFKAANEVAKETNTPLEYVIQSMKNSITPKVAPTSQSK